MNQMREEMYVGQNDPGEQASFQPIHATNEG